jgi:hypothetical protein
LKEADMLSLVGKSTDSLARSEAIHADVSGFLYDAFSSERGLLGNVDRWTQRRVTMENLAKVELVLAADDPVEHCYQNLIREIDTEAETGIYLVRQDAADSTLRDLAIESGVSGEMYREVAEIAPTLFADELRHSDDQLDIVWVTINARYDRARADAEISKIVLGLLLDDAEVAADMADAVRTLMYALHEDVTRRQCDLPLLLDDRETRDLVLMVSELERRAGSYVERVREIEDKAGTL